MGIGTVRGRLGAIALSALVASAVAAPTAFAADTYDSTSGAYYDAEASEYADYTSTTNPTDWFDSTDKGKIPSSAQTPDSRVTAAATRAAMPAAEILGLVSVEESGQFVTMHQTSSTVYQPVYKWSKPKYVIFASNYSSQISPYLTNLANQKGAVATTAVYNPSREGGGNGPNASLAAYGTDGTDDDVWDLKPTVVIGTNGLTDAQLATRANISGYAPKGVNYSFSLYPQLESTMTTIASTSGDSDAIKTATLYNKYIEGTFTATKAVSGTKTVALITNASTATNDDDEEYNVYSIGSTGEDGTASTNRYLETATRAGATNYGMSHTSAIASDLASVDLILVGGQQSSANYEAIMSRLKADHLLNKTYFVKDNGSYGATYGVVMNSVENAQNVGRILQQIYPTVVNQQSWIAYYYENFYHINSANLVTVMNKAMTGVRNWNVTLTNTQLDNMSLDEAVAAYTTWNYTTAYNSSFPATKVASTIGA